MSAGDVSMTVRSVSPDSLVIGERIRIGDLSRAVQGRWRARTLYPVVFGLLGIYSATLIAIELTTSQQFVRHFLTDIEGPVPFYAINTTLSVSLLWATALLFAVSLQCTNGLPAAPRLRQFYLSQILVFAFLGIDDRFKFHEWFADRLGIGDHFVLFVVLALEVAVLVMLARPIVLAGTSGIFLGLGAALTAVMMIIDAWMPHDLVLRLSVEDLAKTWASLCFCLWAWGTCSDRLHLLRSGRGGEWM